MTTAMVAEPRIASRWTAPLVGGFLSLAIALVICGGLVVLGHATFPNSDDGARHRYGQVFPVRQGAAASVLGFQRVPVTLDRQEARGGSPGYRALERTTYRIVVSPLGGLLLIGLALAVGGAIAQRLNTRERGALRLGLGLAVVFTAACFVLSFLVPLAHAFVQRGPNASFGYTVTYRPSHHAAILWPFIWALGFGSLGAFIGKHGRTWRHDLIVAIERRSAMGATAIRAAVAGLLTGISLVLLAGVLTAAVGIAFHPTQAGEVLGSPKNLAGISEGVVVGLPHATGAALLASTGMPGHFEIRDRSVEDREVVSVSIFGGHGQQPIFRSRPAKPHDIAVPRYALGGLLIATAFSVVTGYRASRGSGGDRRRAVRAAVAAALCLTVFLWILAYLVGGKVEVISQSPPATSGSVGAVGPRILWGLVLPPLWAIGGSLLGAAVHTRLRRPSEG